jgi:hypothetical protein
MQQQQQQQQQELMEVIEAPEGGCWSAGWWLQVATSFLKYGFLLKSQLLLPYLVIKLGQSWDRKMLVGCCSCRHHSKTGDSKSKQFLCQNNQCQLFTGAGTML